MVTITNGKLKAFVSKGAFKSLYEPNGWKLFTDEEIIEPEVKHSENTEKCVESGVEYDEVYEEDMPEKDTEVYTPLSEMNIKELRAFAKAHKVDISGAKTATDIRSLIETEMEE